MRIVFGIMTVLLAIGTGVSLLNFLTYNTYSPLGSFEPPQLGDNVADAFVAHIMIYKITVFISAMCVLVGNIRAQYMLFSLGGLIYCLLQILLAVSAGAISYQLINLAVYAGLSAFCIWDAAVQKS